MSNLYDNLKSLLTEFVSTASQLFAGGQVSVKDLWKFFLSSISRMVRLAINLDFEALTREQVTEAVSEAAMRLYRDVLVRYDIPGLPNWLEKLVENNLDPVLEALVQQSVAYMVDMFWPSDETPSFIAAGPSMLYGADGTPDYATMILEDAACC
jgi:hypothetical protein